LNGAEAEQDHLHGRENGGDGFCGETGMEAVRFGHA
jgi:hypothetical protein